MNIANEEVRLRACRGFEEASDGGTLAVKFKASYCEPHITPL